MDTRQAKRALRDAFHAVRLVGAALLAGMIAGATAGAGSRLVMFAVRLMNPSYNGMVTHADATVGRFTSEGTLSLVSEGMLLYGIPGGLLYLIVRRWIPWQGLRKGFAYGCFLLIIAGPVVLDGNYEFFRYVPTWASVGLFALLYPLYGLVVAPATDRMGKAAQGPPHNAVVAWSGYTVLSGVLVWSLIRDYVMLRDVFQLFH